MKSLDGEPDFDKKKKINRVQGIRGNIRKHLNKTQTHTDTQMKFYKL